MRWTFLGIGLGIRVGMICGTGTGLLAGIGGVLFTRATPEMLHLALNLFWLLIPVLPLVHLRTLLRLDTGLAESARPGLALERSRLLTAAAWLPAVVIAVVTFMIPVVMIPVVLNRGVTLETSGTWYDQVYSALLQGRVAWVAFLTLISYVLVAIVLNNLNRGR